ncbi:MAG: SCP2 sterol-binding domain-containing protein [Chloroflexi bacterium]|nr:SCP2 sterol-binding domain-containing protein [Chloroflexota bacterium]
MKLGSLEYLEEVKKRTNADPEYLELAKGNNESYTLVLEPEPAQGVAEQIVVGFDNVDGKMNAVWLGQRPTQFTLSGSYGVWVDILRGKMGATKAITMRKLKTQGPFLQLLQGANRIIRWVEILRTIPTEFEGNYAQYNLPGEPK